MKYFSMFSGIGGFDLALNKSGHSCIGYSEINKYSIDTYKKNFGEEVINYGDATKIIADKLPQFDLLCGGFPCQAFSIAGKRRGFEDTRGTLFFEIARILKTKKPSYVLLENVKGLLNHNKGDTFKIIIQTLDELGYDTQWMVFNSKFFGVPQNRERVFIIGNIRGKPRLEILPFRKINGETKELVYAQKSDREIARIYSPEGIAPTLHLKTGGWQEPKIICLIKDKFQKTVYDKNGISPTIRDGHGDVIRINENIKVRKLTPIECERLQGFPDNWTKGVSDTRRYNQLGNAVTVNVVEAIIKRFNIICEE